MNAFMRQFSSLRVRDVQLSSIYCYIDRISGELRIHGWSKCLINDVAITLTITDETDQLEWTCMIEYIVYRRAADEPLLVKIPPSSSVNHRFVVTAKALRRIPDRNSEMAADVELYEVTSERSCTGLAARVTGTTSYPVFDVRPRLRFNVGIGLGNDMSSILTAGSLLPTENSQSYICHGSSVKLQIYQGENRRISRNSAVHSIGLGFKSVEQGKEVKVTLAVTEDGTLTTTAKERRYRNADSSLAPRIIDVICPKIAVNTTDPTLTVEWPRTFGSTKKVALTINTTYPETNRWRITIAEVGVATGNGGHVFLFPRVDFRQRFEFPSNIMNTASRYEVNVEGLQLIDGVVDDSPRRFRVICRNSATLVPIARPAPQPVLRVDLDLRIQIERSTFNQASLIISSNPRAAQVNRKWKISVKKIATTTGPAYYMQELEFDVLSTGRRQKYDIPRQFEAGHRYRVTVAPVEWSGGTYLEPDRSVEQTVDFRAELTLEDINDLYRMAVQHAGRSNSACHWLYRNKSIEYFQKIMRDHGQKMEVYDKDNSGDPASPINLQIKGLFFLASVERGTDQPKTNSPFGPIRICVPAEELLEKASNVYFVDFYCMRGQNHQVTLVMTKPGSPTDQFCADRLLKLDLTNNPFFFRDQYGQLRVLTRDYLLVELLFTEDLDISGYRFTKVPTVGKGSSTKGGIPKNPTCDLCNLHRPSSFPRF